MFHLLCPSVVGALPVGKIIKTREDAPTILIGLEMLKSISDDAFYGRGSLGQTTFMIDDSDAERNALSEAFPSAARLLCIFHVIQFRAVFMLVQNLIK